MESKPVEPTARRKAAVSAGMLLSLSGFFWLVMVPFKVRAW
jgi:hypothetical protein